MYRINKFSRLFGLLIFCFLIYINVVDAQYVSGQTYYGTNNYIEYKCGNYPLIITVPHGGYLQPPEMADRTCGATDNDLYIQETARYIRDSIYARTGKYPHVIFSLLKRTKLDANREINEATCGDPISAISYNEYQNFIDSAKAIVLRDYGKGLLLDLHGHGHTIQRIEIGYVLTSDDLAQTDAVLNGSTYIDKSSVKYLASIVPMTFSQLIRGPKSMGQFYEESGYPTVPSPSQPNPGSDSYFNGGYTVETHGSKNGGTIDGIQNEVNYSGIRDNDPNRKAFAKTFSRLIDRYIQVHYFGAPDTVVIVDTVKSLTSGNWSSPGTWQGGTVPNFLNDVIISSGNVVTVDNTSAQCKNISFGSTASKLAMGSSSILSIYGNFTLNSTTHNAFSSWTSGAKIKFTGNAIQMLSGWSTSGFSTSFNEMVVDKTGGKVATYGNNMRFSFGQSLEIVNGTFELAGTDDIETRTWDGTASTPTITIQSDGTFNIVGNTSYIRRGNFTGDSTGKIGKMTVYGIANLAAGTTSRISFSGIDIENGGYVGFPTGRSTTTNSFNPGIITIKNGGTFKNSLSTNYWYSTTAPVTPTTVVLNSGGEYYQAAGTTYLPQVFTINSGGTVRYYSTSPSTLPSGIATYENLIFTGTSTKSLGTNTIVNGVLTFSSTATAQLGGYNLTLGPSATISGASASNFIIATGTGELRKNFTANGAFLYPVGDTSALGALEYSPVTLNFTIGTFSSAYAGIKLMNAKHSSNGSTTDYIKRYWTVSQSGISNFLCNANFVYVPTDIVGTETNLVLGKLGAQWDVVGTVNAGTHTCSAIGLSSFSDFTAGEMGALPVQLASFVGSFVGNDVKLEWQTVSEVNNYGFNVQRKSGSEYVTVGFVAGKGTTLEPQSYSFVDENASGAAEYRLEQVDNNGLKNYFGPIMLNPNSVDDKSVPAVFALNQNYPNPFNPSTKISFSLANSDYTTLKIYNILGKEVATLFAGNAEVGKLYTVNFDAKNLTTGLYFSKLVSGNSIEVRKMVLMK
jgi:hypothetical protein